MKKTKKEFGLKQYILMCCIPVFFILIIYSAVCLAEVSGIELEDPVLKICEIEKGSCEYYKCLHRHEDPITGRSWAEEYNNCINMGGQ